MTLLLIGFSLFFFVFILIIIVQMFFSLMTMGFFMGPYYTASDRERIKNILALTNLKKTDHLIDLGAGDGRIVVAAAKTGARATGIEINPIYFCRARRALTQHRLTSPQAKIILGDFWQHDLSPYSVVVVYGISYMMKRLARKLARELKPDTRVISVYFKLPGWKIDEEKGDIRYYLVSAKESKTN
jgi:protein-L-isoaspartate O-methyltransferase